MQAGAHRPVKYHGLKVVAQSEECECPQISMESRQEEAPTADHGQNLGLGSLDYKVPTLDSLVATQSLWEPLQRKLVASLAV